MEEEKRDLFKQREEKLRRLKEANLNPYQQSFRCSHTIKQILRGFQEFSPEEEVAVAGRITNIRSHGKSTFADLRDGSGKVQIYVRVDGVGEGKYHLFQELDLGDFLGVKGPVFKTRTGEITVEVKEFIPLAKALRPLPQKWYGLKDVEVRFRKRYLDLIANKEVKELFVKRSQIIRAIREFLEEQGFMEIETPMMHPIPGGALAKPFVTHHRALDIDLYLRIAPELYLKRLIVGGFDRIYELNRNFRNEGISTRHNPEFTMLELYQAYADYYDLMNLTEEMFSYIAKKVIGSMEFEYQGHRINLTPPWKKVTFWDSFKNYAHLDLEGKSEKEIREATRGILEKEEGSPQKIIDSVFKKLVVPRLIQPTFVYDYPLLLSPLAKRKEGKNLAERFQPFIGGLELGNAYSELNDPEEQLQRFEEQLKVRKAGDEEAHLMDKDYIEALEYGMPPTAGLGIGVDRTVMLFANTPSIREVILFPLLKPED